MQEGAVTGEAALTATTTTAITGFWHTILQKLVQVCLKHFQDRTFFAQDV
jgi:hypothetical protein